MLYVHRLVQAVCLVLKVLEQCFSIETGNASRWIFRCTTKLLKILKLARGYERSAKNSDSLVTCESKKFEHHCFHKIILSSFFFFFAEKIVEIAAHLDFNFQECF
jgi:hypothetical protein